MVRHTAGQATTATSANKYHVRAKWARARGPGRLCLSRPSPARPVRAKGGDPVSQAPGPGPGSPGPGSGPGARMPGPGGFPRPDRPTHASQHHRLHQHLHTHHHFTVDMTTTQGPSEHELNEDGFSWDEVQRVEWRPKSCEDHESEYFWFGFKQFKAFLRKHQHTSYGRIKVLWVEYRQDRTVVRRKARGGYQIAFRVVEETVFQQLEDSLG